MIYGVVKNNTCVNAIVFDNPPTQQEKEAIIQDQLDALIEMPDGFWIGDHYQNNVWEKAPKNQTDSQKIDALSSENKLLKAQLQAQTDRSDFIEEVIAEMATQVYA